MGGRPKYVDKFNNLLQSLHPIEKDFYYEPLEIKNEIWLKKCPYCGKEIECSVWQHLIANIDTHYDIVKQQLEMCMELFFNRWYCEQTVKGYYIGKDDYWNIWYKNRTRLKQVDFNYLKEHSYYNPNFTINLNDFECPICGCDCHSKGKIKKSLLYRHLSRKWFEEKHQQILLQLIGDILHREMWDETCFYDYKIYCDLLKTLYGPEFKPKKKIKEILPRKKIDIQKIVKECYYNGNIHFERNSDGFEICPVCKKECYPHYTLGHISQKFEDKAHYDFLLQIYGDIKHRKEYSGDCFCNKQTFNKMKKEIENSIK